MSEDTLSTFMDRKKEPIAVITRPFGKNYHVDIEWDVWESHVGVFWSRRHAFYRARKALQKKLDEYYDEKEKDKIIVTKFDMEMWGS